MAGLARLCMRSLQQIRSPSRGLVSGNIHGLEGCSAGVRWASSNAAANVDQAQDKGSEISVTRDQGRDSKLAHRRRRTNSLWGNQNFGLTDLFPRLGFQDGLLQWANNLQRMVDEMAPGQLFGRVKESDKAYKVKLEVPGLAKEDLKITIEEGGNSLLIEGEHKEEEDNTGSDEEWGYRRQYGYYQNRLALPQDAKSEEIKAELKNGMLCITIPKAEEGNKKSREIKVE